MRTHKITMELNTQQVVQLNILLGNLNNMTNVYTETCNTLEALGLKTRDTFKVSNEYFSTFSHEAFQDACKALVPRKTTNLMGKVYYVDELEKALENLREVR
jgi:hypothetical protein